MIISGSPQRHASSSEGLLLLLLLENVALRPIYSIEGRLASRVTSYCYFKLVVVVVVLLLLLL